MMMMKQYDFPRIFQNVVGEVVPLAVRNRESQRKLINFTCRMSDDSSNHDANANPVEKLVVQSKKKKLVRRNKLNRTSACLYLQDSKSEEEKVQEFDNLVDVRNFIKKKQLTLQRTEKSSQNQKTYEYYKSAKEGEDDISSSIAMGLSNKRHMNSLRLRTSIDQSGRVQKEKVREQTKQRISIVHQSNTNFQDHFTIRTKPKHKTYFKNDHISEEKSLTKFEEPRSNTRKGTKKKTVNFMALQDKENNDSLRSGSRKGTKNFMNTGKKSAKVNVGKSPASNRSNFEGSSNWSAKTVVSIKFGSKHQIRSKKSLRSQESILASSNSKFLIKNTNITNRYATRTFLKFASIGQFTLKNYKSLTSLSEVSIDLKSDYDIGRSKKSLRNTNKSLKSSKTLKKQLKANSKISILVKSSDPYCINVESTKSIEPVRNSNFQDLIFKKSGKTIFKALRTNTDPDIFTELNNFHKYLKENDIEENDQQMQRVLTKPMVIDSGTHHRTTFNNKFLKEQNLMIDMGLILLKKMSILKQKKL